MSRRNQPATSAANRRFRVRGEVKVFQVDNPWIYVNVPEEHTEATRHLADRGLVAITATLGTSEWRTSLMPMGDGTQFIPLPAKVRKAEKVAVGDNVNITFALRKR